MRRWTWGLMVGALIAGVLVSGPFPAGSAEVVFAPTVDASGVAAPRWTSTTWTASSPGLAEFEVAWSGTANVRAEIITLPDRVWVTAAVGLEQPKTLEAEVTAGMSYRIAVWAMSGTADVTVKGPLVEPPAGLLVTSGTVDSSRATAPSWRRASWTAPETGRATFTLDWAGSSDLEIDVRNNGDWLAANLGPAQPKSVSFDAVAGAQYDVAAWSVSGIASYTITSNMGAPPGDDRPNVLIILTDDQRRDSLAALPQITEWMADAGTTFTNGYVPTPSCCPSRATIMSGQYVHNNGTVNQAGPAFDESRSLARLMQDAGYLTGHVGKYVHYYPLAGRAPNWDRWMYFKGSYWNVWMNFDGSVRQSSGYSTNITFDQAISFVDDWEADDDQPWLLQVAPVAPHRSNNQPPPADTPYIGAGVPNFEFYPNSFETDISDKPPFIYCCNNDVDEIQGIHDAMLRALYSVDDGVDRLLQNLDDLGELDNTLVFFLGDNGWLFGEHQLHEKFLPYENSVGVPFLVRWPDRVPAGGVDDRFIGSHDIAPTVLAAAGLPIPAWMDGDDIFAGIDRHRRLTEYWQDDANIPGIPDWASLTTDIYQYTEYFQSDGITVRFREYYDLVADPFQLVNLLNDGNSGNNPDTNAISAQLRADRSCSGSTCP